MGVIDIEDIQLARPHGGGEPDLACALAQPRWCARHRE
jgi:hypothetical protein